jgi:large subunit ribosomal protein L2
MAVKVYKPTTPGFRGRTGYTFEEITKSEPERSLTIIRREHAGRNANAG